jgi:phage baseplate assembly protein W
VVAHLAFPLRFVDGAAVAVEQDSGDHMRDRVHVVCRTPLGSRLDDPTFGVPPELLRVRRVDLGAITAAIGRSEPEITVRLVRPTAAQPEPPGFRLPGATDDIRVQVVEPAT